MLPDPDAMKLLQVEFDAFMDATKRCDELTQEIQTSFKIWGGRVQQLREVIIHTQEKAGGNIRKPEQAMMVNTPAANSTTVSVPVLPELDRPSVELVTMMTQAPDDDVLWELLPTVEMWLRRCYTIFTSETGGGLDWKYAASTEGQQYFTGMAKAIKDCRDALKTSKSALKAGIINHLALVCFVRAPGSIPHAPTDKHISGSIVDHVTCRILIIGRT